MLPTCVDLVLPNLANGFGEPALCGGDITPLTEATCTSGDESAEPRRAARLDGTGLTVSSLKRQACSNRFARGIRVRSPASFLMTSLACSDGRYVSTKLRIGLTSSGESSV